MFIVAKGDHKEGEFIGFNAFDPPVHPINSSAIARLNSLASLA